MANKTVPVLLVAALALAACADEQAAPVVEAPVATGCPQGTVWDGARCVARAAPAPVVMSEEEGGQEIAKHAIQVPTIDSRVFRDDRRMAVRATALVVVEIQQLESLLRATPLASPDRPLLLRRIAEDYAELGRSEQAAPNIRHRARQEAIAHYPTLVTEYGGQPSQAFPSAPPAAYAQLDEATYYLAYEHERGGDMANARRVYLDLIVHAPNSRFIPRAYLAFGELFFEEGASDPTKWELAKQAYLKVLATPPPGNVAYGYAWYRLAYVFVNVGDKAQALNAFKKVADFAAAFPQLPGSATLGAEAQQQLASFGP
jgi:tetratricopeptide (TPR) repeat protein